MKTKPFLRLITLITFFLITHFPLSLCESDSDENASSDQLPSAAVFPESAGARWPRSEDGTFRIPFVLSERLENDGHLVGQLLRAMLLLQAKSCVEFVEKEVDGEEAEKDFVYFFKGDSCLTLTGRSEGKNLLELGPQCQEAPSILKLLCNKIGLGNEELRPDRDNFVRILWQNVQPDDRGYFRLHAKIGENDSLPAAPYDFESILHARKDLHAKAPGLETIVPKKAEHRHFKNLMGRATDLSPLDVLKINRMYPCRRKATAKLPSDGEDAENDTEYEEEQTGEENSHQGGWEHRGNRYSHVHSSRSVEEMAENGTFIAKTGTDKTASSALPDPLVLLGFLLYLLLIGALVGRLVLGCRRLRAQNAESTPIYPAGARTGRKPSDLGRRLRSYSCWDVGGLHLNGMALGDQRKGSLRSQEDGPPAGWEGAATRRISILQNGFPHPKEFLSVPI